MSQSQATRVFLAGLTCLSLLLFVSVLGHEFLRYDDQNYVVNNPHVLAGFTRDTVMWAFTTFEESLWAPLSRLSHTLDVALFGMKPAGHHFTNLILHILNSTLLFLFLRHATGVFWPSALVAMLFAWHPLHVEPVAWIASRKDVLSVFFALLTLLSYDGYVKRPTAGRMAAVTLCLALSIMSKPMAVTLPFVLLLLDYWPYERLRLPCASQEALRNLGRLAGEKALLFVMVAGVCVLTFLAEQEIIVPLDRLSLGERVSNILVSYMTYLAKTAFPYPLWVPYTAQPDFAPWWKALCAAIVLLAITGGVVFMRQRARYLLTGWLWFLGTLVPVIGVVPFSYHVMADRFTYFPLIGLFIACAWGLAALAARWPVSKRPIIAAIVLILVVNYVMTWFQVRHWRTTVTLFSHTVAVDPDNFIALCNLGRLLVEQGDPGQGAKYFQHACELKPNEINVQNDLGVAYLRMGRANEAAQIFKKIIELQPKDHDVQLNLGVALFNMHDYTGAQAQAYKALELDPKSVQARKLLQALRQEKKR